MQVAGAKCERCNQNIGAFFDGSGCPDCQVFVHTRCIGQETDCPTCRRAFVSGAKLHALPSAAEREVADRGAQESTSGLFSDGIIGLLNKGPIGVLLFGLIAGALSGLYKHCGQAMRSDVARNPPPVVSHKPPDPAYRKCMVACQNYTYKDRLEVVSRCHDKCK